MVDEYQGEARGSDRSGRRRVSDRYAEVVKG